MRLQPSKQSACGEVTWNVVLIVLLPARISTGSARSVSGTGCFCTALSALGFVAQSVGDYVCWGWICRWLSTWPVLFSVLVSVCIDVGFL